MRKTRKPTTPVAEPIKEDYQEGCNDLTKLPAETLRAALIRCGLHPLVAQALPEEQLAPTMRDIQHRSNPYRQQPFFGYGEKIPWERALQNNVIFPRFQWGGPAQPLQSVNDKPTETVVPEELPMEMTLSLLNYGVLQTTIDELSKDQIEIVYNGLTAGRDVAEVAAEAGIKRGSSLIVEDSQALEQKSASECEESEPEDESDHRDERW